MLAPSIKGPVLSKFSAPKPYLLSKNGLDLIEQKIVANWFDKNIPTPSVPTNTRLLPGQSNFLLCSVNSGW